MTRQLKSRPGGSVGWKQMPGQPRVCAGCGDKLTLNSVEPLWFSTSEKESWHVACKLVDLRRSR